MLHRVFAVCAAIVITTPALAEGFQRVIDRDGFMSLVENRDLRRFGIRLQVRDAGAITGRAFGQKVTGAWNWDDGFFCRDLFVGGDELGANCQLVEIRGNTMRFTSDMGQGIYADLKLVD
ncbi:MAG: dihydrodipicolinate reductase [Paracoccaceae bacterium]|nr:dihydrodipicolinate reductase [Paracoccaceae bacterium]